MFFSGFSFQKFSFKIVCLVVIFHFFLFYSCLFFCQGLALWAQNLALWEHWGGSNLALGGHLGGSISAKKLESLKQKVKIFAKTPPYGGFRKIHFFSPFLGRQRRFFCHFLSVWDTFGAPFWSFSVSFLSIFCLILVNFSCHFCQFFVPFLSILALVSSIFSVIFVNFSVGFVNFQCHFR